MSPKALPLSSKCFSINEFLNTLISLSNRFLYSVIALTPILDISPVFLAFPIQFWKVPSTLCLISLTVTSQLRTLVITSQASVTILTGERDFLKLSTSVCTLVMILSASMTHLSISDPSLFIPPFRNPLRKRAEWLISGTSSTVHLA